MKKDNHEFFYGQMLFKCYSVICLNGELPDASFFAAMAANKTAIIAVDGAANTLAAMGIKPDLIIGDLDGVDPELLKITSFIHLNSQEVCDFQKAAWYLEENKMLPAIITGIGGGYLDHVLNNISVFMELGCILYSPPIMGYVIRSNDGTKIFSLPKFTKLSILGIPSAIVSTHGLQWELECVELNFPGENSCFNRSIGKNVEITVINGVVLLLLYLIPVNDAGIEYKIQEFPSNSKAN